MYKGLRHDARNYLTISLTSNRVRMVYNKSNEAFSLDRLLQIQRSLSGFETFLKKMKKNLG
jgi:hypothetical protein